MNRAALGFAMLLIGCAAAHAQYGVPNRSGPRVEGGYQGNSYGSRFNDPNFQRNYNEYRPDGNTTVLVPRGGPSPSRGNSIYIQNPPDR